MPELIDRHKLLQRVYEHPYERAGMTDAEWCRKCIYEAPKIEAEPKINRAAILRLCNDIEDIVTRIYNSDEEIMYNDLISIRGKLKEIGKELTGAALQKEAQG